MPPSQTRMQRRCAHLVPPPPAAHFRPATRQANSDRSRAGAVEVRGEGGGRDSDLVHDRLQRLGHHLIQFQLRVDLLVNLSDERDVVAANDVEPQDYLLHAG
jgi:hypothetical protein